MLYFSRQSSQIYHFAVWLWREGKPFDSGWGPSPSNRWSVGMVDMVVEVRLYRLVGVDWVTGVHQSMEVGDCWWLKVGAG